MAFPQVIRGCYLIYADKIPNFLPPFLDSVKRRYFSEIIHTKRKKNAVGVALAGNVRLASSETKKLCLNFDSSLVSQCSVTNEIQFFRYSRNHFTQMCFSDTREPYGPPLAILLPWECCENLLQKLIEFYGEKGFDVLTVNLSLDQYMFPCRAGHAMNVVTELLDYLNETHKHRPYIFHGFSIGVYIYGEVLAQFSDHFDKYRTVSHNVKGCLWDSPVDFLVVRPCIGKALHPKNIFSRWRCNMAVRHHFKKHHHDSVTYWLRSRDNFCNPIIKVPNVFFVSCSDVLSNPNNLQCAQNVLECNGIPIFQKAWLDSDHALHLEKYCYEYLYGLMLFFNLANLFPEECGKYQSSAPTSSLTNLRLRKKARETYCQ